jgi:protein TonB
MSVAPSAPVASTAPVVTPTVSTTPALPASQPARYDADYLNNPAPDYPVFSRRRHEQGKVLVAVEVDERGAPRDVTLHQTSGHSRLDQAALQAVKRWRFVPARQGEVAIASTVIVPVAFSLR